MTTRGEHLAERFARVRRRTEALAEPLSAEDQQLQSMPSCSPTKWHRAHTTWFWEAFLLGPAGVPPFDPRWARLFNSYYVAFGPRHVRARRGMLSRPSVAEIGAYRRAIDARMIDWLAALDDARAREATPLVELGLAHEEQHQELLLTDILNALAENPLAPAYAKEPARALHFEDRGRERPLEFVGFDGGLVEIGAREGEGFSFDNERPRHKVFVEPFELADRLVTIGEVKAFIAARGYETPSFWLSEGWDFVEAERLAAPGYARLEGSTMIVFGLHGEREAMDNEPAAFLSFYEADAIARFLGARLPTEAEWELAASRAPVEGNFVDTGSLRCTAAPSARGVRQLFGDAWEWTRSAYEPYPGFEAPDGAVGEYNGKFMVGQMVLRGGSCFTPAGHVRASYRNFWHPGTRFQVSGARLARSIARAS